MIRLLATPLRAALTALGLLALGALAFVLVSDSSDSDSPSGTAAEGTAQPAGADPEAEAEAEAEFERQLEEHEASKQPEETEQEKQARETAESVYSLLASEEGDEDSTNVDSQSFCELMSEGARRQTVRYVRRSSGIAEDWDCPSAVEQLVVRSKRTGGFKRARNAEVVGINAEGDRATASVRLGKQVSSIPLVREDGDWRLASNPAN